VPENDLVHLPFSHAKETLMTLPVCVGVEWINTFHPGACSQNNLDYRDDHAEGFYNHMGQQRSSADLRLGKRQRLGNRHPVGFVNSVVADFQGKS